MSTEHGGDLVGWPADELGRCWPLEADQIGDPPDERELDRSPRSISFDPSFEGVATDTNPDLCLAC